MVTEACFLALVSCVPVGTTITPLAGFQSEKKRIYELHDSLEVRAAGQAVAIHREVGSALDLKTATSGSVRLRRRYGTQVL